VLRYYFACGLIGDENNGRNKLGFIEVCSGGWSELKDYLLLSWCEKGVYRW
jgi:hypothetical protein